MNPTCSAIGHAPKFFYDEVEHVCDWCLCCPVESSGDVCDRCLVENAEKCGDWDAESIAAKERLNPTK